MWETIPGDGTPPIQNLRRLSHRLKVPGGWVVRTIVIHGDKGSPQVDQIFISDFEHEWQISDQN